MAPSMWVLFPGQIMTAYGLLQKNPNPTQADIRQAFKGHFMSLAPATRPSERSILAAARACRTGKR